MSFYDDLASSVFGAGPRLRQPAPFGLISVQGPDAVDFLQRLCSQDVRSLEPGEAAPMALLNAKGKLVATAIALRGEERVVIEATADQVPLWAELLERYHFSERLELETLAGTCVESVERAAPDGPVASSWTESDGDVSVVRQRHGIVFRRTHGASVAASEGAPLTEAEAELVRIATGQVWVGRDTEKTTLGPEAHLEDAIVISEAKGCYTGQEIVARIRTYGHVNRALCLLSIEGEPGPDGVPVDTSLCELEEGAPVGRVKTTAFAAGLHAGLGYLPKDFWEPGTELRLGSEDGPKVLVEAFAP